MNFRKTLLALSVLGATTGLGLSGCGGSSHDHPAIMDVSVSGTAAKGLVFGGLVNIHPIINGALSDISLGTARTDGTGAFSIDINGYDGSPFVVRTTADTATSMRCDLAGGCGGGVAFGQQLLISDSDFQIDAVVPPVQNPTALVNLSVLTDTASELALSTLSSGASIEAATTAISNANSSVANRFGITGDITTLPVVDLTDPAAVAAASDNILNFNLLSASIVEALIGGDPTLNISTAIQSFATQYTTGGGLADTEGAASTTVTLAEILAQSSAVIDAIQAADTGGLTTNLATLETTIDADQVTAAAGSTTPSQGVPDSEGGGTGSTTGGSGGSGSGSI